MATYHPNTEHDSDCSCLITAIGNKPVIHSDERRLRKNCYEFSPELDLNGITNDNVTICPELDYKSRKHRAIFTKHNGQMKLLFSEIQFLTRHARPGDKIVYAGAAPGIHLKILFQMFPNLSWVLIDPAKIVIRPSEHIEVIQGLMTDDLAESYQDDDHNTLFISDIRTGSTENEEWDEEIEDNMIMQKSWCDIMKPRRALLKFRLSWKRATTTYFSGTIFNQVWQPKTSTETRLDTDCKNLIQYNNLAYERRLMGHNSILRIQQYSISALEPYYNPAYCPHLCRCYDCINSILILNNWIASAHNTQPLHPTKTFALIITKLGQDLAPNTKTKRGHSNITLQSLHSIDPNLPIHEREARAGKPCIRGLDCDCTNQDSLE